MQPRRNVAVGGACRFPWMKIALAGVSRKGVEYPPFESRFACMSSLDWWMYHGGAQHTGAFADSSIALDPLAAKFLQQQPPIILPGSVLSVPAVVSGKAYVGTVSQASGGNLVRVDLTTGTIEKTWASPQPPTIFPDGQLISAYGGWPWGTGFASTPAVVGGEIFCAALESKVFCLDAGTLAVKWSVDLLHPDLAHRQFVDQGLVLASCWTSPLVVNGRVFVGVGRGDDGSSDPHARAGFGFIYCLDAATGDVIWLFCTSQFHSSQDNLPNQIPQSSVSVSSLAPPFVSLPDPPNRGAAVWSSCAYDAGLNRIYVGVGNMAGGGGLPGPPYSNGVLSLDAGSGELKGFFEPSQSDAYAPTDGDLDMSGSPTVYTNGYGDRVVGIGGKSGSYFLLEAEGLNKIAGRQLIPYKDGNPILGSSGASINSGGDYGIFSAASVDAARGWLFVVMGNAVDSASTPILRALRWNDLMDAWPTTVTDGIIKYDVPGAQQLYQTWPETASQAANWRLTKVTASSPAIVNGVVLVTTWAYATKLVDPPQTPSPRTPAAIYAFDCANGALLWSDAVDDGSLGPALWPGGVVAGGGRTLRRWVVQPTNPPPFQSADIAPQITPLLLRT